MPYWTYALQSVSDGRRYVGSTENLQLRVTLHNQGKYRYTKGHRPWRLIYAEAFATRSEAVRRECILKSGVGRRWLTAQIGKHLPLTVVEANRQSA